jgi:hypothetical protein
MPRILLASLSAIAFIAFVATRVTAAGAPDRRRREAPAGIGQRALQVGVQAPALSLPAADGSRFVLQEALSRGPAVLLFFRGDW